MSTQAGRAMDALIAEKVMGWTGEIGTGDNPIGFLPRFSTDIAAAWLVVERMAECGEQVNITVQPTKNWGEEDQPCDPEKRWRCLTHISGTDMCWHDVYAPTAPLAICRAALDGMDSAPASVVLAVDPSRSTPEQAEP